jgi:hypothetical protein
MGRQRFSKPWRLIVTDNNPNVTKQAEANKEAAKKRIAEDKAAREQREASAPEAGKPTPTQEENDLAKMGVHLTEHEPDGSPEQQPHAETLEGRHQNKQATTKAPTPSYQTRQARPTENA